MARRIAVIIPLFFLCLGLDNCKSPEEPEKPEPTTYEYRYNIKVIYTPATVDYPERPDLVQLRYILFDPAIKPPNLRRYDGGVINMEKVGENKYRCYLHKAFVPSLDWLNPPKHSVLIETDTRRDSRTPTAETHPHCLSSLSCEVKLKCIKKVLSSAPRGTHPIFFILNELAWTDSRTSQIRHRLFPLPYYSIGQRQLFYHI